MPTNFDAHDQKILARLVSIIEEALSLDLSLREQYAIGDKFRFIRERLEKLAEKVKTDNISQELVVKVRPLVTATEDETLVYVHLYNAQGTLVSAWRNIITPKAFFDYSVNRPIYQDKKHVETFIQNKTNRIQHGYLVVAVKQNRFVQTPEPLKDSLGHPLFKVKEGSLLYDRLLAFIHNEVEYVIGEQGELIKK